jgi:hypothetical protein
MLAYGFTAGTSVGQSGKSQFGPCLPTPEPSGQSFASSVQATSGFERTLLVPEPRAAKNPITAPNINTITTKLIQRLERFMIIV